MLAVDRCKGTGFDIHANVAQIMAAIAVEAFISEYAFDLSFGVLTKKEHHAHVGAILDQLEVSRVQVTEKFRIASQLLPGDPYAPDKEPFQSFNHLIKLRNYLAHPKMVSKPPGWFSYFISNDLVIQKPDAERINPNWTWQLQNKRCASWACRATARIILDLIGRLGEPYNTDDDQEVYEHLMSMWDWIKKDERIWSA